MLIKCVCLNTSTDSWMATKTWWIQAHLCACFPFLRRTDSPIGISGRICFLAFEVPSYARTLVIKSPSGCPWFTLNCCVMAGPCRCQVAIKIRALSSNPRSAQVYKNCPTHTVDPCMLWHVPSLLHRLYPKFHVGTCLAKDLPATNDVRS